MHTYIKRDVINRVAAKSGRDYHEAAVMVNALFDTLQEMLMEKQGECRIEIRNFGVFEVKSTSARPTARNPRAPGMVITIPPHLKVNFKAGKKLKRFLMQSLK